LRYKGIKVRPGNTVELSTGDFFYITESRRLLDGVNIQGKLMRRCTDMDGIFEKKTNELCFISEVDLSDRRSVKEQAFTEMSLPGQVEIITNRILVRTNAPFPRFRFTPKERHESVSPKEQNQRLREEERLVVRWVYEATFNCAKDKQKQDTASRFVTKIARSLTEEECQPRYYIQPSALRCMFRGETVKGGMGVLSGGEYFAAERQPNALHHRKDDFNYWCEDCGRGFSDALPLVNHYQRRHEHGKQQPSINEAGVPDKRVYTYGDMCKCKFISFLLT
jgi:hypothetical protein